MLKTLPLTSLPALLLLTGCNWVQVTDAGQDVSLAVADEVRNCTRLGTSQASSLSSIGFIQRGGEKLQEELVSLARNEAADMGGNRVVAESTIQEGNQTFGVYRCPD